MIRTRSGLLAVILVLVAVPGAWADRDPSILAQFDVYTDGDFLLIPVTVHGKTYPFVVDTGCENTVIDASLTKGEPIDTKEWKRPGGKVSKTLKLYKAPAMKIGPIAWQSNKPVVGEDLNQLREISGHLFFGIIGMDFLSNYAVKIDFDLGKLFLLNSPTSPLGKTIPIIFLEKEKRRPFVVGDIDGWGPEVLLIDTGDIGFGSLKKNLFQALARKGLIKGLADSKSCTLLGMQKHYDGWLKRLAVGDESPCAVNFGESTLGISNLGIRFWQRYNMILDFPAQTLHLQRRRVFANDDLCNWSGLTLQRKEKKTVVLEIIEKSPAAKAGLMAGDAILKIDGEEVGQTRVAELMKLFSVKGKKVRVVYERDQTEAEVVLSLNPWEKKHLCPTFLEKEPSAKVQASLLSDRGLAYHMKKEPDRAIADFDEAIRLDPGNVEAYVKRAEFWVDKKETSKALADYSEAIPRKPKDPELFWGRALVYQDYKDPKKALQDLQECLRLVPKNPLVFKEMGRVYAQQGEIEKALANADEAIRLDPADAEAVVLRAACFRMRKQPEKALQEFGKAIAINPKCAWAYVERGILLLQGGDCDKALPDLNKGIQLGHRTPQVFFWRAMVFHVQKNEAKVIPDLEESARLDPTSSLAHLGLAWTLSTASDDALRDGRKALVHAQKGCELTDYKNPGALETLAAAHAECGNFRDAVRWQKEALQLYAGADILSGRIIPVAGNQTTELARRRLGSYERNMPTRE